MRHLLSRLLGHDKKLARLTAQRDANRELATEYARQLTKLEEDLTEAASWLRGAHRQLNLKHSSSSAQDMIMRATRLLEGNK